MQERERERIMRSKRVEDDDDDEEDFAMAVYTRKGGEDRESTTAMCVFHLLRPDWAVAAEQRREANQKREQQHAERVLFSHCRLLDRLFRVCLACCITQCWKENTLFRIPGGRNSLHILLVPTNSDSWDNKKPQDRHASSLLLWMGVHRTLSAHCADSLCCFIDFAVSLWIGKTYFCFRENVFNLPIITE